MKIVLSEKQVIYVLQEALELSKAREYVKIQRSPEITQKINEIFEIIKQKYPNSRGSKRGDRLYIPFGSQLEEEITEVLENNEFAIKDYDLGIVTNTRTGQDTKIGKALMRIKREDLLTKYTTDKSKGAISNPSGYMVYSKHPYDIAGMSTGRDWTSCMNLDTGSNRRYVSCDITEGSFVVYLIDGNDINIQNPKGRIAIKPFINQADKSDIIFFPEERSYGSIPSQFKDEIINLFSDINRDTQGIIYSKNEKLYNDSSSQNYTNMKKIRSAEDVEKIICNVDDRTKKELALNNELVMDYVMRSPRINHYVKESIVDQSRYDDISKYLTPKYLYEFGSVDGLHSLVERFPLVRHTILNNAKLFEKKFLSLLLRYSPDYLSKVSSKDVRKLSESQFFDIFTFNPKLFPTFYDKFKDKMAESASRLTYFLEDNPEYLIKAYPTFRPIFRELSEYNRERFISNTMDKNPSLFNFYLNNEKPLLDEFFKDQTMRNEKVFRNNKLFYLVHTYYKDFVDDLVFNEFTKLISLNESLIPFFIKFYRKAFDTWDTYDIYKYVYYHERTIPVFVKYLPELLRKLDSNYIGRILGYHPEYTDILQSFYNP